MSDVKFTDNSDEVLNALEDAVGRALEAIGIQAESHAKANLTEAGRVDTGRLRNSITHQVGGNAGFSYNYSDDRGNNFSQKVGSTHDNNSVYIGTNVEYAPYIEDGTSKITPTHYLKNAAANHAEEYKQITKQYMENA